jgi:hypothetical protein
MVAMLLSEDRGAARDAAMMKEEDAMAGLMATRLGSEGAPRRLKFKC